MKIDKELLTLILSYLTASGLHNINKGASFNQKFAAAYVAGKGLQWISDNYSRTILDFLEDMAMAAGTRDPNKVAENRARRIANRILEDNKLR